MKQSADDNFKLDENIRKFSKRIENTVGKGEIARYEQFLLFPQCFQKACCPGVSKGVIVWEWFKHPNNAILNLLLEKSTHIFLLDNVDSRSKTRLHVLCSLILIYNVFKS